MRVRGFSLNRRGRRVWGEAEEMEARTKGEAPESSSLLLPELFQRHTTAFIGTSASLLSFNSAESSNQCFMARPAIPAPSSSPPQIRPLTFICCFPSSGSRSRTSSSHARLLLRRSSKSSYSSRQLASSRLARFSRSTRVDLPRLGGGTSRLASDG